LTENGIDRHPSMQQGQITTHWPRASAIHKRKADILWHVT